MELFCSRRYLLVTVESNNKDKDNQQSVAPLQQVPLESWTTLRPTGKKIAVLFPQVKPAAFHVTRHRVYNRSWGIPTPKPYVILPLAAKPSADTQKGSRLHSSRRAPRRTSARLGVCRPALEEMRTLNK